jgi:hypothetical protein
MSLPKAYAANQHPDHDRLLLANFCDVRLVLHVGSRNTVHRRRGWCGLCNSVLLLWKYIHEPETNNHLLARVALLPHVDGPDKEGLGVVHLLHRKSVRRLAAKLCISAFAGNFQGLSIGVWEAGFCISPLPSQEGLDALKGLGSAITIIYFCHKKEQKKAPMSPPQYFFLFFFGQFWPIVVKTKLHSSFTFSLRLSLLCVLYTFYSNLDINIDNHS